MPDANVAAFIAPLSRSTWMATGFWEPDVGKPDQLRLNIFLVASEHELPYMLQRAFEELNIAADVHWEGVAATALEVLAKRAGEGEPIDLIIVDWRAGNDAGVELVRAARRISGLETVVVAVFTGEHEAAQQPLIEAGADALFQRRWQFDELLVEVRDLQEFWLRNTPRVFV